MKEYADKVWLSFLVSCSFIFFLYVYGDIRNMYHIHKQINSNLHPVACSEANKGRRIEVCGTLDCKLSHAEHFSQIFVLDKYDLSQSVIYENPTESIFCSKILSSMCQMLFAGQLK